MGALIAFALGGLAKLRNLFAALLGGLVKFTVGPAGGIAFGMLSVFLLVQLLGSQGEVKAGRKDLAKMRATVATLDQAFGTCKANLLDANAAVAVQKNAVQAVKDQSSADTSRAEELASAARKSAQRQLDHAATIMLAKGSTCEDADALIKSTAKDWQ